MEPPSGVDNQQIHLTRPRGRHRVEHHRARIRPRVLGHHGNSHPITPQLQLVDSRRTERVARGEHHPLPLALPVVRELRNAGRLADPVYSNHQQHAQLAFWRKKLRWLRRSDLGQAAQTPIDSR